MIVVALGSNLPGRFGSPGNVLREALLAIASAGIRILDVSGLWITAPVPLSDQARYHNAVISVDTQLSPDDLLMILMRIEDGLGRVRAMQNEARIIDLDLIDYHGVVMNKDHLILPHPRMHQRLFVLYPLKEIMPEWRHPVLGQVLDSLLMRIPDGQVADKSEGREWASLNK